MPLRYKLFLLKNTVITRFEGLAKCTIVIFQNTFILHVYLKHTYWNFIILGYDKTRQYTSALNSNYTRTSICMKNTISDELL